MTSGQSTSEPDLKKLKVTMVCWNRSDDCVITAVSDHTLKIWTVNGGQLEKVLPGHTDEIYVLEAHPHDNNVILSAGHDGQLFIWDILKGEIVFRFLNTIEGQGYGAIFDVKWSPNGCIIGASDSHGHILTFGFGTGSPVFEQVRKISKIASRRANPPTFFSFPESYSSIRTTGPWLGTRTTSWTSRLRYLRI